MSKSIVDNPGVIAFPPALYAGTLFAGLLLNFLFPIYLLPRSVAIALGAAIIFAADFIAISAIPRDAPRKHGG